MAVQRIAFGVWPVLNFEFIFEWQELNQGSNLYVASMFLEFDPENCLWSAILHFFAYFKEEKQINS